MAVLESDLIELGPIGAPGEEAFDQRAGLAALPEGWTLRGFRIMPGGFTPWTVMIMAPGAFFTLGIFIWIVRAYFPITTEGKK